jgi:DnaJ-class molecular chaperone
MWVNQIKYRCWACVGNGLIAYPYRPLETCSDCKGSGVDEAKSKKALIERYRRLRVIGLEAWRAWWLAHKNN